MDSNLAAIADESRALDSTGDLGGDLEHRGLAGLYKIANRKNPERLNPGPQQHLNSFAASALLAVIAQARRCPNLANEFSDFFKSGGRLEVHAARRWNLTPEQLRGALGDWNRSRAKDMPKHEFFRDRERTLLQSLLRRPPGQKELPKKRRINELLEMGWILVFGKKRPAPYTANSIGKLQSACHYELFDEDLNHQARETLRVHRRREKQNLHTPL